MKFREVKGLNQGHTTKHMLEPGQKPGVLGPEAPPSTSTALLCSPILTVVNSGCMGLGLGLSGCQCLGWICLEPGEVVFKCFLLPNS